MRPIYNPKLRGTLLLNSSLLQGIILTPQASIFCFFVRSSTQEKSAGHTGRATGEVCPRYSEMGWNHAVEADHGRWVGNFAAAEAIAAPLRLPAGLKLAYTGINSGRMGRSNGKFRWRVNVRKKLIVPSILAVFGVIGDASAAIPDGRYICSLDDMWVGDAGSVRGDDKYVKDLFSIDVDGDAKKIVVENFAFPISNPLPAEFDINKSFPTRYEGVSEETAIIVFKGYSYVISNVYSERTFDGNTDAQGIATYVGQCDHSTEDNSKIYDANIPNDDAT